MTTLTGTVSSVDGEVASANLTADVAAIDTTISVDTASIFDPDGGTLAINDDGMAYTTADANAGTVTLSSAAGAIYETGLPVTDPSTVTYYAEFAPSDPDADTVRGVVPPTVVQLLPSVPFPAEFALVRGQWVLSRALDRDYNAVLDEATATDLIDTSLSGDLNPSSVTVGGISIDETGGMTAPAPDGTTSQVPQSGGSGTSFRAAQVAATEQFTSAGSATIGDTVFNGAVTFATGVQPPGKPTITSALKSLTPTTTLSGPVGLTENSGTPGSGTAWVVGATAPASPGYTNVLLVEIDKTTGIVTNHVGNLPWAGTPTVLGVARISTNYYAAILGGGGSTYVYKYDSSFAYVSNWTYSGTTPQAFGTDGTNLLFAYTMKADLTPVIRVFTTAGVQVGSNITSTTIIPGVLQSVWSGSADFGATRYVLTDSANNQRVFNTSGTRQSGDEWTLASQSYRGLWWDGTRFHSMSSGGIVYHYATHAATETVTATSTITDGTAETAAGTASSSASWPKRWWLNVTVPAYPTTPSGLSGKAYVGTTSTRKLQTLTPALSASNRSGYIDSLNTGSATAPSSQSGAFASGNVGSLPGLSDAWTAYTPAWTSTGTAPALGNATVDAAYQQFGKTVRFRIFITLGSTSTVGTGSYRFSLPVTAKMGARHPLGPVVIYDSSTTTEDDDYRAVLNSTTTLKMVKGNSTAVSQTNPWTWATSDEFHIQGEYEAA